MWLTGDEHTFTPLLTSVRPQDIGTVPDYIEGHVEGPIFLALAEQARLLILWAHAQLK